MAPERIKAPRIIDVGTGDDQSNWIAPGVLAPNQPPPYDPASDKQVAFDQGTAGGSAYTGTGNPQYQARRAAINQLFPGIAVSRFLNTLGANDTNTPDRYGSSPLFSALMLQGQKPQAAVPERATPQPTGLAPMDAQPGPVDVAGSAYDPLRDAGDFTRSRRTGSANPYRRQAMNALFGA